MTTDQPAPLNELQQAQLEQLRLQNEKLKAELRGGRSRPGIAAILQFVPVVTALVAVGGFWWGIHRYGEEQAQNRRAQLEQGNRQVAANEREFMKPWLENQRQIYLEALAAAAEIANSESEDVRRAATETFWRLYHGKMILVETTAVSDAMMYFGRCLVPPASCDREDMNRRSKRLASLMADSMAATAKMTYKEFAADQFKYR